MKYTILLPICIVLALFSSAFSEEKETYFALHQDSQFLTLDHASMCEAIKDYTPHNEAVVFSTAIGKVSCFTSFDPVPRKTYIYHKWYYKDKLSTKKRLLLYPPRWSTYSSIQLRETDIGPWRVEIYDDKGKLLKILRFSITE